ncbi:Protein of unknown function [Pyronema omphalodes CBS 100304]|uniref:Uncharacterized protein n=1 Tax=Pyronema omphalodes (strain CBS 100304) TaxID=1076935 RepID=U4L473_PYROM|nr:Protein of unknown function [Pyronema omphalodes CBS 100304]
MTVVFGSLNARYFGRSHGGFLGPKYDFQLVVLITRVNRELEMNGWEVVNKRQPTSWNHRCRHMVLFNQIRLNQRRFKSINQAGVCR